jgi:hypothetical protein
MGHDARRLRVFGARCELMHLAPNIEHVYWDAACFGAGGSDITRRFID